MTQDERHMRAAIAAARCNPQAPFGAVLVDQRLNRVICCGFNKTAQSPILHGEIDCLRVASDGPSRVDWEACCLYSTAEPCCMCQSAILWCGIPRVVFGTSVATLRSLGWPQFRLDAAAIVREAPFRVCTITSGVLKEECDQLFHDASVIRQQRLHA